MFPTCVALFPFRPYMDEVETEFLQSQRFKALVWWKCIDNVFIIWTHNEEIFASLEKT